MTTKDELVRLEGEEEIPPIAPVRTSTGSKPLIAGAVLALSVVGVLGFAATRYFGKKEAPIEKECRRGVGNGDKGEVSGPSSGQGTHARDSGRGRHDTRGQRNACSQHRAGRRRAGTGDPCAVLGHWRCSSQEGSAARR